MNSEASKFADVVTIIEAGIQASVDKPIVMVDVDGKQKFLGAFLSGDLYKNYDLSQAEIDEIMDRYLHAKPSVDLGRAAIGAIRERDFRERAAGDDTLL